MSQHKEQLQTCVREAIKQYFVSLDGTHANNIYALVLEQIEQPLLATVLQQAKNNQSLAAQWLGISRNTLRKLLKKYEFAIVLPENA